jgi:hypothetical protein
LKEVNNGMHVSMLDASQKAMAIQKLAECEQKLMGVYIAQTSK